MMTKKKSARGKKANMQSKTEDKRVAVILLKGSLAYRQWLNAISRHSLISAASIVRDALAKWAKQRGYSDPPEI